MKPWVEDLVDQLSIADNLSGSSNSSVRRVAYIITDNAAEVAVKTYVEFEKGIGHFNITRTKWEDEYKPSFRKSLGLVVGASKAAVDETLLLSFHDTRNSLYHDPKLLSVERKRITRCLEEVRSLVNQLFGLNFNSQNWSYYSAQIRGDLFDSPKKNVPTATPSQAKEGVLRIEGLVSVPYTESVAIAMQRFLEGCGRTPSIQELRETLKSSGKSPSNLSDCIIRLRKKGFVKKHELSLTQKGQDELSGYLLASRL